MLNKELYKRIIEKKKKLSSIRPLNKDQLKVIKKQFIIEYVYNSTTIEGNTLTLNETKLILQEGITVGGKSLREQLDVINQKQAMEWIEEIVKKNKQIKEINILELHRLTLKGISDYLAGKYKISQNRILGSKLKTTPPYKVSFEIKQLVYEINTNKKLNPVELASHTHHELVRIHPFADGNGRTARLLTNLILMKAGFPPIIIQNRERKKYFDTLEKAHFGNIEEFTNFIGKKVEESLTLYLNALVKTTKENELIPLKELSEEAPYSQEYLSLRARQGKLFAVKIEGVWYSSREDLKKYLNAINKNKKN